MNIQQLEYFIAIDKYKHFGKAAQACFITQPTLSAMIQKLEDELNVKIFDRTSHPIRTTDAGLQLIIQAKIVINAVNELKQKAEMLNDIIGGSLNLGIIPTISTNILPNEIFDFLEENKNVEMNIKEMMTENIIKGLKSGELDAGIISTPYLNTDEFYHDVIFHEELMVYSDQTILNNEAFVLPDLINVEKVWLLEEGNCLRTQFENICQLKENSHKPKNLNYTASHVSTLVQMVDRLGGITIIPELVKTQISDEQNKKIRRFRKPYPYREISIIYYKPTYKQRIIDSLVKFIKNSITQKLNYYKEAENYVEIKTF